MVSLFKCTGTGSRHVTQITYIRSVDLWQNARPNEASSIGHHATCPCRLLSQSFFSTWRQRQRCDRKKNLIYDQREPSLFTNWRLSSPVNNLLRKQRAQTFCYSLINHEIFIEKMLPFEFTSPYIFICDLLYLKFLYVKNFISNFSWIIKSNQCGHSIGKPGKSGERRGKFKSGEKQEKPWTKILFRKNLYFAICTCQIEPL